MAEKVGHEIGLLASFHRCRRFAHAKQSLQPWTSPAAIEPWKVLSPDDFKQLRKLRLQKSIECACIQHHVQGCADP